MHCIKCDVEINEKNGTQYFNYVNNIKNIRRSDEINEDFILCDKCYDKKNNIEGPQTPPKPHKAIVSEIIIPNDLFNLFMGTVLNSSQPQQPPQPPGSPRPVEPPSRKRRCSDSDITFLDGDEGNCGNGNNKNTIEFVRAQEELEKTYSYEWLGDDIHTIDDLIKLGEMYNTRKKKKVRYNLNLKKLNKLTAPLTELKKMIGLNHLKDNIFNQIIYYLQELDNKNTDMLHTVIQGPPGVGKTHVCQILAKIYKGLGFLKNDKVTSVKRDDLIGKYLGQTADKTRKVLDKALGGVLFIDEAYSLGDTEGRDSYSKEAIDMITAYLSEHPHDLICIIAGYKEALNKRFFSQNEGLSRRFAHRFDIEKYTADELRLIFFKIVEDGSWRVNDKDEIPVDFFEQNIDLFMYNGGDMLTLFGLSKKTHAKRLLSIKEEATLKKSKKYLTYEDINNGLELFLKNPEYADRLKDKNSMKGFTMYS